MVSMGRKGSVVSLICDPGDRYVDKYYSDKWLTDNGIDTDPYRRQLESFLKTSIL
jgi:cysteine synthase A